MSTAVIDGQHSESGNKAFVYRHVVTFEETNLMGNVYFVRHLTWQGRCRELFLRTYAPDTLEDLGRGLKIATLEVGCKYFDEVRALDEVDVEMSMAARYAHGFRLSFRYFINRGTDRILAATGFQDIKCLRLTDSGLVPTTIPVSLANALEAFV